MMKLIRLFFSRQVLLLVLLLTGLNFFTLYLPWVPERYDTIVQATKFKTNWQPAIFHTNKFDADSIIRKFLLVDISNDVVIKQAADNTAPVAIPADSPVAAPVSPQYDIDKLTELFKWLSTNQEAYNLVVCNLYLDDLKRSRETDSLLKYIVTMAQHLPYSKILLPAMYDAGIENFREFPDTNCFFRHIPFSAKGAVNEELVDDQFYRYQLSYEQGKIKTMPLLMLERIDGYVTKPWMPGMFACNKGDLNYKSFNTFLPEMIYPRQVFDSLKNFGAGNGLLYDTAISKMAMSYALLRFNKKENYHLAQMLKASGSYRKTVFIDAFEPANGGLHKTMYGQMSGGMLLLNIYFNLLGMENRFDWMYLLFTFVCFWWIAYLVLCYSKKERRPPKYLITGVFRAVFLEELHIWVLIIMTIFSSLIFDKAAHALIMAFLLGVISKTVETRKKMKDSRAVV